jgi:hypothetical protein
MPGPLGTLGPTVDPNWAWDTPAWTSQANTGDTIGTNLGSPGQGSMLVEPAALSGYIARTLDPDVSTTGAATFTFTSGTVYLSAFQVMDPATTTKCVVAGKAVGTSAHAYAGLYNAVTGAQLAVTADLTNFGTTAASHAWATAATLSPGYYWGAVMIVTGTTTTLTGVSFGAVNEAQLQLTGTAAIPFVLGTSLRFATGGTGLTGLTTLPTALAASNVVSANNTGYFFGIF